MKTFLPKLLTGWGLLCLLTLILSSTCSKEDKETKEPFITITPSRIIVKETTGLSWADINQYEIVEVDGIEYLTSNHGGIIVLPKR